jgi:AbrB family looped-hinge helix DNA binding protein
MGFVTVNSKSLVVIPKSVRDRAQIYPGDKMNVEYDEERKAVVMTKLSDVAELGEEMHGMWEDNKFSLEEMRETSNERINKLLKNKLQQKGSV